MFEHYFAVIMAGGGGTRLWPLSRLNKPKQLLKLGGDQTLFELAVARLQGVFPPGQIIVVTTEDQAEALHKKAPQIPPDNFLLEPKPKGTASVVGFAAAVLAKRDPEAVMAVLTADHLINNVEKFQKLIVAAYFLSKKDWLVTLGILPEFPSTGYGYIQQGTKIDDIESQPAFQVVKFKEKPDLESATRFIAGGNHFWNSGMFFWRVETIMNEFKNQMPDLYKALLEIKSAWNTEIQKETLDSNWDNIQPQTIDYGIMEGAKRVAMLPVSDLGWSDVGSWDSLFAILDKDKKGTVNLGATLIDLDCKGLLVYSEDDQKMIVSIGTQDMVIIDTHDAILVCPRDQTQRVKEIVKILKENGHHRYL